MCFTRGPGCKKAERGKLTSDACLPDQAILEGMATRGKEASLAELTSRVTKAEGGGVGTPIKDKLSE